MPEFKQIKLYAHIDRDTLREKGEALGLVNGRGVERGALHYFTFFNEIAITATVNMETGEVVNWEKAE